MADDKSNIPKKPGDFDFFANFDDRADEMEKEFEQEHPDEELNGDGRTPPKLGEDSDELELHRGNGDRPEEIIEEGEQSEQDEFDLDDEDLEDDDFFGEGNAKKKKRPKKVGKKDVESLEKENKQLNSKEESFDEEEELERERGVPSDDAGSANPEDLDEEPEETGSAADVDDEVAEIDRQWEEDQEKAKQMARDEADKKTREIYERAHRRQSQYNKEHASPQGTPSGIEDNSSADTGPEVRTAADEMLDRQSHGGVETELVSEDDSRLHTDDEFEMERERVPDYNQWRTTPRTNKDVEEVEPESANVTGASGIDQTKREDTFNTAASEILNKQGKPNATVGSTASEEEGPSLERMATNIVTGGEDTPLDSKQEAAVENISSGATTLGTGIAKSASRKNEDVDQERNKQAKSVQSAAKKIPALAQYYESQSSAEPSRELGESPSSITGASGISEAPKEESAAGGWEYPGLGKEKTEVKPAENVINDKKHRDAEYFSNLERERGAYGQRAPTGQRNLDGVHPSEAQTSPGGSITGASGISEVNAQGPGAARRASDAAKAGARATDVMQKGAKLNALTGAAGAAAAAGSALLPGGRRSPNDVKPLSGEGGGFADVTGSSKRSGISIADVDNKNSKTSDPFVRQLNQDKAGLGFGKKPHGGSGTIRVNGQKATNTGEIEAKGLKRGKVSSKDSSFSYDEETGQVKMGGPHTKDAAVDKHMKGGDTVRIIDSDEALKKSHSVAGKGISGKKEDLVIKNGEKLKIAAHGTDNIDRTVTTKMNGKIRIGKQEAQGIVSKDGTAGIKMAESSEKGPKIGGKRAEESARNNMRTGNATQEYYKDSAAKNGAIKLSRDGTSSGGRANELLETAEENKGKNSRLNTSSTRRAKRAKEAASSRTAKMNMGRGARVGAAAAGGLAASAEDAKKASSASLRFRRMWGIGQTPVGGMEAAATEPAKKATKRVVKTVAKKVMAASLATTIALGAGTAGQVQQSSKSSNKFNNLYYLPQAHLSSEYDNDDAPVMTKNVMTKMGQRLNAYQTIANGGTITGDDPSTQNLHDIDIASATLNGSNISTSGLTFSNLKDFSTSYTYSATKTYPAYTQTVTIPESERGPDGKTTQEIIIPSETRTATKTENLSTSSVSVNFEFDDKDGNPISIGSGAINVGNSGDDITATGEAGKIIEAAKKRVGGKYVWGGNKWGSGPSDTAVDCSHYVWHVLMEAGVYNGGYMTAVHWASAGRPVNSLAEAQAGDVVVYGDHHVAIYDGNGYIYEAQGSATGITHDRKVDHEGYVIRRFAADGTSITVNNKGGAGSAVSSPGSSNTPAASGASVEVPSGLGEYFRFMGWQCITSPSSTQYKLREQAGMKFDDEGFGIIDGRYVIACTTTYGQVGDLVDFYQSDGTVFHTIIGDIKNPGDAGCTQWGHEGGHSIIEFVVNKDTWYNSGHANPGESRCHPEWGGKTITKGVNLGSWFNGATGGSGVSASSASGASNARTYFMKEILAMSALGGYYASPADVEKYNKYCFDILDYAVADWKGADVAYNVAASGSTVTLNDGRSDIEVMGMQLNCTVTVHVCTELKILEEHDPNRKGVWDLDATEHGDGFPYNFMLQEPKVFDLIFNVDTSNSFGGGMQLTAEERVVYDFFSGKGLSDVAIAGILANVSRESSFDPTSVNSSSGASGLFQWLGGRLTNLEAYAKSKGTTWKDKQCQLEFAWAEMSGDGSVPGATMQWSNSLWSQFQSTNDPYEAGSMFGHYWERYGSAEEDNKRGELAKEYYGKILGGGGTGYMQWALAIAADDSHGYSQRRRDGNPDYDCSSLVYYSLYNTGWPIASICPYAFATGSMDSVLTQLGFQKIVFSSTSELMPGDILLRDGHTEIYIGNGQNVGAHSDENGGIEGAMGGDQTGREISVGGCSGWSVAYRAPGGSN